MATLPLPIRWAQRPDCVLLTIPLQDVRGLTVELPEEGRRLVLRCTAPGADPTTAADDRRYEASLELYAAVAAEESSHVVRPRQAELRLAKRRCETDDEREWPRLTRDKEKLPHVQIDWSRWRDADDDGDDDDLADFGAGGESGINYEDMISQFMVDQGREEAAAHAGGADLPKFGEARGQQAMTDAQLDAAAAAEADDFDDMPPLEDNV